MPSVHTLGNGVRVVADPAPGFETLALTVAAGRGARSEDEARSGWSHLLEHMVFKGAGPRSARDIVEAIEARGGQINAATGYERTSFQVRALAGGLRLGMEVTADLVLRPTLDAGDLAREIEVVGQEIAEAADAPDDLVFELAQAEAFAGQPLGRPVLGSETSIAGAEPQALEAWRAGLYAPDRLVVSAAGAIDETELLALAEEYFGAARGGGAAPAPSARFTGGRAAERRKLEQAHLVLFLPGVAADDPDYFAVRVFAEALGGGMSSRLFQEARERLGLAYAIDAFTEAYADTGLIGIYAGCAARHAARLAEVAALEVAKLAEAIEPAELERAKAQLKAGLFMGRESLAARAEQAAAQILTFGRLLAPAEIAAAVDAVGAARVRTAAQRLLGQRLAAGAVLGPARAMDAAERFARALFG
ncbi:MAG TPA: pitrilysin family protein [Caulobacteraceae bacterium]|nr:pitrilysin family protein [Caulobacteraceae bacterium]